MRDKVSKFSRQDARIMSLLWLQTNDSEEGKEGSGNTRESAEIHQRNKLEQLSWCG